MRIVLISTYDLGRQPFGLASPAAWLARAGAEVTCNDLAVQPLDEDAIRAADGVAFHLPMHTATRLAIRAARRVRELNPRTRLAFYGLYAAMNESHLRSLGADFVLGGEFEAGLARWASGLARDPEASREPSGASLERLRFVVPDRRGLPALSGYAHLHDAVGSVRTVGYTEASRGCKHTCRHCPVVPVYRGRFRVVEREVVLEDIRRQIEAGAEHVTFGDPDFFNGIGHAIPLVRELHARHPSITYDVTIKIEHLLQHREFLPTLRETGCLFVTSAVESIDDHVLSLLEKGHTRADFVRVAERFRLERLALNPTFIPFTPWTTLAGYRELLAFLGELELTEHVAPIQLAIRLLVPAGSRLLEMPEARAWARPFDPSALVHPWSHEDPEVDALQVAIEAAVREAARAGMGRAETFERIERLAARGCRVAQARPPRASHSERSPIPYLTEPWYC